ncbi:helix-turn-helix domain-containing protein [Calidifontibacillus erzurumensis]|uniref:Helix-turn-helix protein n=1 Tax=Calidifontibacillus erzurumensis TaxID=2741433 RepID=A0A8J8KED8_9BACI|nr:helix-turn-helix domain-containing protein [Calidifontibacillus erzurumensis]NSL51715.1 hypothetical protein [Calidifontibacillus erzurumensis]
MKGSRIVFNKSEKLEDSFFIKLPSNLKWYIYIDGYKAEMNYLYALIVDYYNADEGCAYPSMLRLSREYGKTEPTTRAHLQTLKDVGLIDFTDIRGKKYYVPFIPLDQEELFRQFPEAEEKYKIALQKEEQERKRSLRNWVSKFHTVNN